jgi:hypothetical protein
MDEVNQFCDVCGQTAISFCLQNPKTKVCSIHAPVLSEKHVHTFPIEDFYFIDSLEDVPIRSRNRKLHAKGLEIIAALKTGVSMNLHLLINLSMSSGGNMKKRCSS